MEHTTSIKEFFTPFTSPDDKWFKWLINDFLSYFEIWQESIQGNFTIQLIRRKCSCPIKPTHGTDHNYTYNDDDNIQEFVLTGRVSQDQTLENFGRHRAAGRRNEHPSLYQFGYDSNMIRMSRSVVHVTGNSKGAPTKKEKIEWPLA